MQKFKKTIRRVMFILFIILAAFGVGMSGGAIMPQISRRHEFPETKIEMVEEIKDDDEAGLQEIKE